jgi:hypothetical protein
VLKQARGNGVRVRNIVCHSVVLLGNYGVRVRNIVCHSVVLLGNSGLVILETADKKNENKFDNRKRPM